MQPPVFITSNSSIVSGILRRSVNPKDEIQNGESENWVLGETFATKREEVARAGENCIKRSFINWPNGTTVIISRKMRWVEHVARMVMIN
jgi:hypothetical protein